MAKQVDDFKVFTLRIEGIKLDNVSLVDVGHYLEDFAQLLGDDVKPKFHSIKKGSIKLAAKVPRENEIDVKTRSFLLRTGDAPEEAVRAEQRISKRLGIHHARKATIVDSSDTKVIEIPIASPGLGIAAIPALTKFGTVQGQIIRIGGKLDVVTVDIQDVDGHIYGCKAKREIAKVLGKEIFGPTVRVAGMGKWCRDQEGVWYVEDFLIASFEVLEDEPAQAVLDELKRVDSVWHTAEDPVAEHERIRRGEPSE